KHIFHLNFTFHFHLQRNVGQKSVKIKNWFLTNTICRATITVFFYKERVTEQALPGSPSKRVAVGESAARQEGTGTARGVKIVYSNE
ncbi:MAG: hypothetical protein IJY89_00980, partial [Clostridia bacterium]|nr:hypothetical protein [Clostridia bacterium]